MSKQMYVVFNVLAVAFVVCLFAQLGFCQYGTDAVGTSLANVINWTTKAIGGSMFVVGLIITGVKLSTGSHDALKTGGLVIVGGLIIFLATNILALIKTFTGAQ